MPIEPISNFIAGIKAASGYTPLKNVAASLILNFDIDDFGRLVKRRGYERMNSVALPATPKSLIRAYYRSTGIKSKEHLIVACNNATGVWYWNVFAAAFVELKSSSHSPTSSINLSGALSRALGAAASTMSAMLNDTEKNGTRSRGHSQENTPMVCKRMSSSD